MKAPVTKPPEASQTPVFPKTPHRLRQTPNDGATNPKSSKRNNTFSQSRDVREDRGTRQIKTKHNSETLFRMCGDFQP
jgi:hypothetical protein